MIKPFNILYTKGGKHDSTQWDYLGKLSKEFRRFSSEMKLKNTFNQGREREREKR